MIISVEDDTPYYLRFEWCQSYVSKWCREIMSVGYGSSIGIPGCYNPREKTICFGLETLKTAWWKYEDKDAVIRAFIDVICHEEIHRVIHKVTRSAIISREVDIIFTSLYNYSVNREYFHYHTFEWFGP